SDAIKSTVSKTDFDKATGKLTGDISTLQQRANGFDATVTKINNLAVGGRNLYLNSRVLADNYGTNSGAVVTVEPFDSVTNMWHIVAGQNAGGNVGIYLWDYANGGIPNNSDWSYSADIKGTGKAVQFGIEASDKSPVKGTIGREWSRISQTGNVGTPQHKTIVMYFDTTNSPLDVYIKLPKLEIGNVATDWIPAPEDVDSNIAQVKLTADGVSDIVSNPTTGLSTRVQKAEGTLSTVAGTDIPALKQATFWQPYSSLNFNDYTKQGSFFFNTTAAKTNGPTSSNSWIYLMVEQGTSGNDRIKQTAWYDGVNGVKVTYVRTLNSGTWSPWYANDNDSVTTISQTNSSIQREITDRQNGDSNTLQAGKDFTTSQIKNYDSGVQSQISQVSDGILAKVGATNLFPNSEFDADYGYRRKDGQTVLSLATKNNIDGAYNGTVSVTSTGANWQGYWTNNIQVQGGQKYSASVKVHYTNGGLTNGVALLDLWFVDRSGNRISSATATTSQVSSPYWVQLISEGFTAPINAVYLQMSLLVSNAGAGQVAVFTQPMLTATEKLQKYTPNNGVSAQLSLLKDNWALGINDNSGALIAGINGDTSNVRIAAKQLIVSADTTFQGINWLDGAIIRNASIGTAQIANAAIGTAQISSLDVAKISGNTTNFIKSNWNSAYNNVTIDSTGMIIKSSGASASISTFKSNMQEYKFYIDNTLYVANQITPAGITIRSNITRGAAIKESSVMTMGGNTDGFSVEKSPYGLNVEGIEIGDPNGAYKAENMAFGISMAQSTGVAPQLIWAGSATGKVIASNGKTWDNPAGWIIPDNIRFSTWDSSASQILFDSTTKMVINSQRIEISQQRASDHGWSTMMVGLKYVGRDRQNWIGFTDGSGGAGVGFDGTQDVWIVIKGLAYSMYDLFGRVGMR
ncbi:pyocin knob domain-containing protein, partial [Weissella confusa]|uniref:pyocin knob domain-containing protein n=1 Tax=Weissella confusa TaxID=1583 RepID=UPI00223A918A